VNRRIVRLAIVVACGIVGWLLLSLITVEQSDYLHWFRPVTLNWARDTMRLYVDTPGFRNPPWTVLLLLPFALLPTSWGAGLVRLLTVGSVMVAAQTLVESRQARLSGGLLALFSVPMLDALYRVQLVGFVILGAALGQVALRRRDPFLLVLALLLVTVKPQLSILLVLLWLWVALRYWPDHLRWRVIIGCIGWMAGTLALFGPRWPLDWLAESGNWLMPDHPALLSSPWKASLSLGLPAWSPAALALALGLAGGPHILQTRGQSPLTAGWAVVLSMLLTPYQHPFDSLVLLALALPPSAAISVAVACLLYILSFSPFLGAFGWPLWLNALLPVGTALILTCLCWHDRCAKGAVSGDQKPKAGHVELEMGMRPDSPVGGRR